MPGVYVNPERGLVACADHVEAHLEGGRLVVENPTAYDAGVKILVDSNPSQPLGELWWRRAVTLDVPAHESAELPVHSIV